MEGKANRAMGDLNRLNLTDAQRQQIRNIRQSHRDNEAVRNETRELAQARRDGNLTAEQRNYLKHLREQRRAETERIQQQILNILTPEQRRQLELN